MAPVVKWVFTDTVTLDTYTLEINPNEGAAPERAKQLANTPTVAPGGRPILSEGQDNPTRFDFSGTLLSEEQHDALWEWWDRRVIVKITDDFERDWYVYIERLRMTRLRKHNYPWAHSWSMGTIVVA